MYFKAVWRLSAVSRGWLCKRSSFLMAVGVTWVDAAGHVRAEHHTRETEAAEDRSQHS